MARWKTPTGPLCVPQVGELVAARADENAQGGHMVSESGDRPAGIVPLGCEHSEAPKVRGRLMTALPATPYPEPLVVLRWVSMPEAAGQARSSLRRVLERWKLTGLTDRAELVLSELFTNSLQHADGEVADRLIETRFALDGDGVRIEVHDASYNYPELRKATSEDEGGRGLELVNVLTRGHWGVSEREGVGKLVWAHVTTSAGR